MAKTINYAALFTLRKDGRYMGYWKDTKGKRHAIYHKDPEKLYFKIMDKENPPVPTVERITDEWLGEHREHVGFKTYETYIAPARRIKEQWGDQLITDISTMEINAFLSQLGKQDFSRRSVQLHRDILNMIFNYAIVNGHQKYNPCTAVSMPRGLRTTPRLLPSDDAIQAVKNGAEQPFGLFALICLYAGLRKGEALALRYEDIDRKLNLIHVNKAVEYIGNNPYIKSTKTVNGIRDVILLQKLADVIPKGTGYIFSNDDGSLLTKTQYHKRWKKYCALIGHDITAHQLRHGFATILFEAGVPDKDAQELLGHSNITLTKNIYTHIRQSHRNATADILNKFINEQNL